MGSHFRAAALCAALLSSSAWAYDVKPMVVELSPSGSGSSATVTIANTHKVPIAIEVSVHDRKQQPDGSDALTREDDDLIVTPPQLVLQPGASQAVRIQWVGEPDPKRELDYRLITEQLPIPLARRKERDVDAQLTMKYRYEVALYVIPRGAAPSARLESAEVVSGQDGRKLHVAIASEGTRRSILDKARLTLSSGGRSFTVDGEAAAALQGLNVLPGSTRVVILPAPPDMPTGKVSGELETGYLSLR